MSLQTQIYLHSVDTSAFYDDDELLIHNRLVRLYSLRKRVSDIDKPKKKKSSEQSDRKTYKPKKSAERKKWEKSLEGKLDWKVKSVNRLLKKEKALLKVFQSLCKSCDDMDFVAKDLTDEKKDLLNAINDTVFDARHVVAEVLIQDKKDDLLLEQLQKEFQIVLDFLSENRLMAKFIEHKSKYDE